MIVNLIGFKKIRKAHFWVLLSRCVQIALDRLMEGGIMVEDRD
jgi:hypothetical protein